MSNKADILTTEIEQLISVLNQDIQDDILGKVLEIRNHVQGQYLTKGMNQEYARIKTWIENTPPTT